ncbi:MAG: pyruvate kinase, partial [Lysinibacillus sp.]
MRKTKIVCTIGPASESPEMLENLISAGMNVARLNFSHGSHEEHAIRIAAIRDASEKVGKPVGILLDTKGPEIRTHSMENGELHVVTGQVIDISMTEVVGNENVFSVTYEELINDVDQNDIILLDDGLIQLRVLAKDTDK